MKSVDITEKIVLGTAQFGMDYGIANVTGKPSKEAVFDIIEMAWEKGVRRFDTAPGYGSEALLGEFIITNGLRDETILLTKLPSLGESTDYITAIRNSLESSLEKLGCNIEVLFFHNPEDSLLLLKDPRFFENLLQDYPLFKLGVSIYEPLEVESLSGSEFELAFQFPFNVLDRRFEKVNMPRGKRYARSIFLQGLLASPNGLRSDAPEELFNLQREYHDRLADHFIDPINFSVSFTAINDAVDYFLIGVDTEKQLQDILNIDTYNQNDVAMFDTLKVNTDEKWFDPRNWSKK